MKALLDAMYTAGYAMDPELTLALKAMIQAEETWRTLDPRCRSSILPLTRPRS